MSGTAAGAQAPAAGADFRTFLVLWSTQTLSLFGSFVSYFATNIWLTRELYPDPAQKPALALALTATAVATTGPTVFLMPIAGAWADRHDRRRTMLIANVLGALFSIALVAMLLAGRLDLWTAVALLVGYSAVNAFHSASFDSGYVLLVVPARLQRASGMMQTSFALSALLGPAIAATLIAVPSLARDGHWGVPWVGSLRSGVPFAFAADAVSFLIAAAALLALRLPSLPRAAAQREQSLWHDMRDGLHWIVRRRPFLWLISFGSLANFVLAPLMVLLPLLVRDRLAEDLARRHVSYEAGLAIANTAAGVGGVLGGILVSAWGGLRSRRVIGMVVAMMAVGVFEALAGAAPTLPLLAFAMFALDLPIPFLNTSSYALWQSLTPPELLGRALSTRRFIAQSFYPIGSMVAGWVAVLVEPSWVVIVAGGALALFCAAQLLSPSFHTLEHRMQQAAADGAP